MADDVSGIDPRYAAQFQRGYDPARDAPREQPRPGGPVKLAGGPPPTAERVPAPPPLIERPAEPATEPEDADDRVTPAPVVRRILDWALLAVGAFLVLLAVATYATSATDVSIYTGPSTPSGYAFAQARNSLAGPLLAAGVLAISAWITIHALRPGRSR